MSSTTFPWWCAARAKRIIYSHCRWSNIEELGKLGEPVAEKVTVISCKRMETDA